MLFRNVASVLAFAGAAAAAGCAVFDSTFNLYVLGLEQDVNLGAQPWTSATATPLTATDRPPFDGTAAPRCYLAQFPNIIYVLGADAKNPTAVWVFNVASNAWSLQAVAAGGPDPTSMVEILDHDTNTFYAASGGAIWFLSVDGITTGTSTPIAWTNQNSPPFLAGTYTPTLAIAQNHIFFFGVPGSSAGQASIYVIHFAFAQPAAQAFAATSGAPFPVSHGQAPSLFLASSVQELVAFIPDDLSATYLIDVKTNTSTPLAAPSDTSAGSTFYASESAVVQLTPAGKLFFLPIDQTGSNAGAAWTSIAVTLPTSGSSGSGSTNSSSSAGSGTGTGTGAGTGTGTGTGTTTGSGAGSTTSSSTGSGSGSGAARVSATGGALLGVGAALLGALVAL